MVPSNLKVFAKFGLRSNCSQKLHECSLARAFKMFASARVLGFSLNFPKHKRNVHLENKTDTGNNVSRMGNYETLGKHARAMNVSGKFVPSFVDVY